MIRKIRAAAIDSGGAAAIEFALILPFLFVMHIASAEALQAYRAQRNVAHIASAIADLTARNRVVTNADVDDILVAASSMMHPFPMEGLQQRVASISASSSGSRTVDWQRGRNFNSTSGNPTVPSGYLSANESVIVTDVIYDYRPSFGLFLPDTIRFTRHAYARPRLSPKVEKAT